MRATKEKGITLIALVVTIVVLLILAGVSISLILDENGVIQKAKDAKTATIIDKEREQVDLAYSSVKIEKLGESDDPTVSAQELQDELDKTIGTGKITVIKEGNILKATYTETNRTYEITDSQKTGWDAIIDDAKKHPDQDPLNPDIGIGTDGQPVNLNLWKYYVDDADELHLGKLDTSGYAYYSNVGYLGEITNGEIEGKIPQYIKINGKAYPTKHLDFTFKNLTTLAKSPEIPSTVISMYGTFYGCTTLQQMPELPENLQKLSGTFKMCTALNSVTTIPEKVDFMGSSKGDLNGVFSNCSNLSGTLTIDTNCTSFYNFFWYAATAEGADLTVTGKSEHLDEIIATKSETSNIHR